MGIAGVRAIRCLSGPRSSTRVLWFTAFHFLAVISLTIVAGFIGLLFGEPRVLAQIAYCIALVVSFVPSFAVMARRLHDVGRSGWWYLIAFVPIAGAIVLLVWLCRDSTKDNRWGPSPKVFEDTPHAPKMDYSGV